VTAGRLLVFAHGTVSVDRAHDPPNAALAAIAAATVAGAWLGVRVVRRRGGRASPGPAVLYGAASGVLLAVAAAHVLPQAVVGAHEAALPEWLVPAVGLGGYVVVGAVIRRSCPCEPVRAGGAGAAVAVAVHRAIEGTTLAVTATLTVGLALAVHAAGEGVALAAVLLTAARWRAAWWILLAAVSPAAGFWATGAVALPSSFSPVALALVGGVLLRSARIAAGLAAADRADGRRPVVPIVAGLALAAAVTSASVIS